jgi:hypothetical protein
VYTLYNIEPNVYIYIYIHIHRLYGMAYSLLLLGYKPVQRVTVLNTVGQL